MSLKKRNDLAFGKIWSASVEYVVLGKGLRTARSSILNSGKYSSQLGRLNVVIDLCSIRKMPVLPPLCRTNSN